jgi:glutamine synthetase
MGDCVLDGELLPAAPRSILRRAVAEAERHGVIASVGHELEFWLFRRGEDGRLERYAQSPGLVYRMDPRVDPGGVLRQMEEAVRDLGLPFTCANQEYDPSQWEINCRFATALEAADDAHFLKLAVKEVAAVNELVATFIGKPFGGGGTSGYHLHLSLWNGDGSNLFEDAAAPDGLSSQARWFIGGLMEHARELTAVLGPTVNAYKRYASMELGPYFVDWGLDNRSVFCRIPPERGRATRVECRAGDGAANAYLASAALLFAGLDGIDRELDPGPPSEGVYDPPVERAVMPLSLREALDELEGSKWAREKLGEQFIQAFAAIKRHEERRYQAFLALEHPSVRRDPLGVTTWEHEEYVEAL